MLTPKGLSDVLTTTYVLLHFGGMDETVAPSDEYARQLIATRWTDTGSDRAVYHLATLLDHLAPSMSERDRVELVRSCHAELRRDPTVAGGFRTRQNTPASLHRFVRWQ